MNLQQDHYRCPTQSRAALLSHAALRGSEWWAHPCHLHLADCSDTGRWAAWSYPFVALTIRVGGSYLPMLAFASVGFAEPVAVDAWVRVVTKDGAASDMFGETQSLVNRTEERL